MNRRKEILKQATEAVVNDRNVAYGDPSDDFRRTARYWSTHIGGVLRRAAHANRVELDPEILKIVDDLLDPHDVAVMMIHLKTSRMAWSPENRDNWLDAAGYSACGWDAVER